MSDSPAAVRLQPMGEGVALLTLNRPERGNALSAEMVLALDEALDELQRQAPRLLVLQGAGRHFCTGFDLSDLEQETDDTLLARFVRVELLLQRVAQAPYATLALAQGRAMGAGADLFVACQARWILGDARFAFPGAGFGLVLGTRRLAATVGATVARQWVNTGVAIDSAQALQHGLATRHLPPEERDAALAGWHQQVARLDDCTHQAILQAVRAQEGPDAELGADDLSRLVRSAARRGLKQRIAHYRASLPTR